MKIDSELTLGELGERRIVRELLGRRYAKASRWGDDAASMVTTEGGDTIVATTDPCPPPMSAALGATDLYYAGWLLATINFSDLAAAGARPVGLLSSLLLPPALQVSEFERLLDGIDACCELAGTTVVGGNLKEGETIDLSATAIGVCRDGPPISRSGGEAGDAVVVIGDLGSFWAGVLAVRAGRLQVMDTSPLLHNVLTPTPKTGAMRLVAQAGLAKAAIDNSDGLCPSFRQLAAASEVGVYLDAESFRYESAVIAMAAELDVDPLRLALGWGDWQVIIVCAPDSVSHVQEISLSAGTTATEVGRLIEGRDVKIEIDGQIGQLMRLESERFSPDSWFSAGIDGYVERLLNDPLIEESNVRPGS